MTYLLPGLLFTSTRTSGGKGPSARNAAAADIVKGIANQGGDVLNLFPSIPAGVCSWISSTQLRVLRRATGVGDDAWRVGFGRGDKRLKASRIAESAASFACTRSPCTCGGGSGDGPVVGLSERRTHGCERRPLIGLCFKPRKGELLPRDKHFTQAINTQARLHIHNRQSDTILQILPEASTVQSCTGCVQRHLQCPLSSLLSSSTTQNDPTTHASRAPQTQAKRSHGP